MQQLGPKAKTVKLDENLLRHMILNSLRSYVKQFKQNYGEIVICCDSQNYWRRAYFPFYKANRKKDRDASGLDWKLIFDVLAKIRGELKEFFPYKVIEVDGAEADDVIGTLAAYTTEDTLILSSDKDFMQLQKYPHIAQYSPVQKKFIRTDSPAMFLREHILRGDPGDGIPNFLSGDNTLATGIRQKSISSEKLQNWLNMTPDQICSNETMAYGFSRNETLVNLDKIPADIQAKIMAEYNVAKMGTKTNLLNYFMDKRLTLLISVLDEF